MHTLGYFDKTFIINPCARKDRRLEMHQLPYPTRMFAHES